MPPRIAITATGIITALGTGAAAQMQAIRQGKSGLRHPEILQTRHAAEFPIGEVNSPNAALAAALGTEAAPYTRTTLLALAALQDMLQHVDVQQLNSRNLAIINAGTVGGMCTVEDLYLDFTTPGKTGAFTQYADTLSCARTTLHMAEHSGLKAQHNSTLSTACSSSANALMLGARMLQGGVTDAAICGGCDSMSRFTLNGFLSLKNLDRQPCKPFDQNRNGLNLGEGAAYLLLEREDDAVENGRPILAFLSGYANGNDAYHPTAPSPDGSGALRTMKAALDKASIVPEAVSYINAHGTATHANDLAEGRAIEALFGGKVPFSSTKPFTGHTLAAAGSVEAVFSVLCLQAGLVPPNLNFSVPMEELHIEPVVEALQEQRLQHIISNSFGFGGSNVSLVFSHSATS